MGKSQFSDGLITLNEYVQARVQGLLGRSYDIEIDNGYHNHLKNDAAKKERTGLWRNVIAVAKNMPQNNIYLEIDVLKGKATLRAVVNIAGDIDNYYDTPFHNLKIYERLW